MKKWTIERVRNSFPEEFRNYHEGYKERCALFYRGITDVLNLVEKKEWELVPKFRKEVCSFFLINNGAVGRERIFGILLKVHLPYGSSVDRNGESIGGSLSTPPRLLIRITEEEAKQLERQYGCEFCAVGTSNPNRIYYYIPDDITDLRPVLEFAYNRHRGN